MQFLGPMTEKGITHEGGAVGEGGGRLMLETSAVHGAYSYQLSVDKIHLGYI